MSVDLSQFHQAFFEESFEGLDVMESSLLALDLLEVDAETINTIFRAAHSIKGGAGTFGFMQISNFTHVVETLLDEIRSGDRDLEQEHLDMLLQSVDCLRSLLSDLQAGSEPDMGQADTLKKHFEQILAKQAALVETQVKVEPDDKEDESTENNVTVGGADKGWRIDFIPCENILCSGNEPYRMFRELKNLADAAAGTLEVISHLESLPAFSEMDPEMCYLSWTLIIRADIELSDVEEIFEWVIDDSEIRYQSLADDSPDLTDQTINKEVKVTAGNADSNNALLTPIEASADLATVTPKESEEKKLALKLDNTNIKNKSIKKNIENTSIRVSIDKIDELINMVGELVITQSMLGQLGQDFDINRVQRLQEGLSQLEQNTRELQESVLRIRMLPISFAFSRFPRLVRDLSKQLEKDVNLVIMGENTELDKTVMEKIGDPLVHLVRNSLDHGLECAQQRIESSKSSTGTITLNAYHQGGSIVIEVKDDGVGLNKDRIRNKGIEKGLIAEDDQLTDSQIYDLIFQPGFSTADVVSDVSGRGVGMDVVRRNISELNGSIDVATVPGKGSVFTIRLPLTLAILDGQLVKVGNEIYIFPLISLVESIQLDRSMQNDVTDSQFIMQVRDEYIPIINLQNIFNIKAKQKTHEGPILVVVESDNGKIGIVVDELLGQQQVVIKSLEKNYQKVDFISGATILGDGKVALIVDVSELHNKFSDKKSDGQTQAA